MNWLAFVVVIVIVCIAAGVNLTVGQILAMVFAPLMVGMGVLGAIVVLVFLIWLGCYVADARNKKRRGW